MTVVYVSDEELHCLFLKKLTNEEIIQYQETLKKALSKYSTNPSLNPPRMLNTNTYGTTFINMPIASKDYSGIKTLTYNPSLKLGFIGTVSCFNSKTGELEGIVSAKVLTGVRTALCSCIGLNKLLSDGGTDMINKNIVEITVLGSGLQSFWHIVICIKTILFNEKKYGIENLEKINVNVIYRNNEIVDFKINEILQISKKITISQFQFESEMVEKKIDFSDIIFGCTPSLEPLLKFKYFKKSSQKSTYISLIGSYKEEMHECDDETIKFFIKNKLTGVNKIMVDSKEQVLIEAGEFIDNKVKPCDLVEIGEITEKSSKLSWAYSNELNRNFFLCKLVGLAIMDISTAQQILKSKSS